MFAFVVALRTQVVFALFGSFCFCVNVSADCRFILSLTKCRCSRLWGLFCLFVGLFPVFCVCFCFVLLLWRIELSV